MALLLAVLYINQKLFKRQLLTDRWLDLFAVLIFILVTLFYANGINGFSIKESLQLASDAGNIASYAAAGQVPGNFQQDALLSNPGNYSEYFAFHIPLIGWLGKLLGSYSAAFNVLLAPSVFLQLLSYYLLARRLITKKLLALIFSLMMVIRIVLPLSESFGIFPDVVPRFLFQVFLPYALLFLVHSLPYPGWHWFSTLVFTAILYVHPVSGPVWLAACLLTLLIYAYTQHKRDWWKSFVPSLVISIFGVLPFLRAYFSNPPSKLDPVLLESVHSERYSEQVRTVGEFITHDLWAFLTRDFSLASLALAALFFFAFAFWYLKKQKSVPDEKWKQTTILLSIWWAAIIVVFLLIPLLDEVLFSRLSGGLMFREIRRNIRYLIPLFWLSFLFLCAYAMEKLEGAGRSKLVIWLSIAVLSVGYVAGTQPSLNPAWMRTQACLKEGRFPCKPTPIEEAKYVFYASLDDFVDTTESVFPDLSPRYLADSLIPRYFSLRSVAYTYKDGGAIGSFLPEWWRVTQALTPYPISRKMN